jgi:nitroreductase
MEVFDAIRTLLAVRSYQDKPVPDDVARRILEAGRMSGSASNRQPWQFIVVPRRRADRRGCATCP